MNDFNLSQWGRDLLFPALMMAAVLLGAFMTQAKGEVLSPNGVPLSSSEWAEKSPDTEAVTVREALSNSDNPKIAGAIPNKSDPILNLVGSGGGIWHSGSSNAEIQLNIINKNGSPEGSCTVSSEKGKDGKYVTAC